MPIGIIVPAHRCYRWSPQSPICLETGSWIASMQGAAEPGPGPKPDQDGRMQNPDELSREIQLLRERISRLSAASLRISASLDFTTVLHEVLQCAQTLTGAARMDGKTNAGPA